MKYKNKMLILVALVALAIPLMFAGNAGATTYNPDGSTQVKAGGWTLDLFCVGTSKVCSGDEQTVCSADSDCTTAGGTCGEWDGLTGSVPPAVRRTDLPNTRLGCAGPAAVSDAVEATYTTQGGCQGAGYLWEDYGPGMCADYFVTTTYPNPTDSPTGWNTTFTTNCLKCHSADQYAVVYNVGGDKASYLQTGHKNMTRPVTPTQGPLALNSPYTLIGPDGNPYPGVDWSTGVITAPGLVGDLTGQTLLWGMEGWAYLPNIYQMASGSFFSLASCARCHDTGWTSDATANLAKEPYRSFGAGFSFSTAGNISGDSNAYGSWDQWGVQCSRCHQATDGGHASFPENGATGGDITAMCATCHRQEAHEDGIPEGYPGSPVTDNFDPNGIKVHYVDFHGVQAELFGPVYQFLNSPHARFTGTFAQIGCPPYSITPDNATVQSECSDDMSAYGSTFKEDPKADVNPNFPNQIITLAAGKAGGCTSCHDVHYSVVQATGQATKATKACTYCHSDSSDTYAAQIDLSRTNHPQGPGTPFDPAVYESGTNVSACTVCHMPGGDHYFRINTSASYETITVPNPIPSGWGAYANVADDDGYANAIWNDLDASCGQCHGGGTTAPTPDQCASATPPSNCPKNGAPQMTKAQLSTLAEDMHNTNPMARFSCTPDSSIPFLVNCNASTSICPSGVTCDYEWDFGDGQTGEGLILNHQYADGTAREVTLTVSAGGAQTESTATQSVTPAEVHAAPTCDGTLTGTATVTVGLNTIAAAKVGETVTYTDNSTADSTAGVYINWGDGSGMSNTGLMGSAPHVYIWPGNYTVVSIVQDDLGYSCTTKKNIKISAADVAPGEGDLTITTDASIPVSYYVKGLNDFGDLVTKASGSFDAGSVTVSLVPGDYQVYLYYGYGHSCTFTQGQTATVVSGSPTTVGATSCN